LTPGDESYDAARKVCNPMIDKGLALIVQCAGIADEISALVIVVVRSAAGQATR
jgi:hypothetical protein